MKKIDTELKLNTQEISYKPEEIENEVIEFENTYKEFNFDNIYFDKTLKTLNVSIYNKKTKENDIYQMCSLIYPSKWFRDEITKKTKYEVTYYLKSEKRFEKIILNGGTRKSDLLDILRELGVGLKDNMTDINFHFNIYFFNALTHLYETTKPSKLVSQFGLQEDGGFAIGNMYIEKNGYLTDCDTTQDLSILVNGFKPKGTVNEFLENVNKWFSIKGTSKHKLYSLCLISSPILSLLDKKGCLVNFHSTDSGLGKSLSQMFSQMFYRNYADLDNSFTVNSVIKEASLLNGLPVIIEEFSDLMRKKPDEVLSLIHLVTGGKDKKRLNKNAEQVENKKFRINLGGSSNIRFFSIIPSESIAELVRTPEISVTPNEVSKEQKRAMYYLTENMKENCGHGYIFIKKMMEQRANLIDVYKSAYDDLIDNVFKDERFRYVAMTFAGAITFAELLLSFGVKIDIKEIEEVIQKVADEILFNFNDYIITKEKIINDLLTLLKINHYKQESGKALELNENYNYHNNADAIIVNNKNLIIPKAIFDNRICLTNDKRIKPMFSLTSKEVVELLNSDGSNKLCKVDQKNIDGKRQQCMIINIPLNQTVAIVDEYNFKIVQEDNIKVMNKK